MDTPVGGEPTQPLASQDWTNEPYMQDPRKLEVRCPCGSSVEEPGMVSKDTVLTPSTLRLGNLRMITNLDAM